MIDFNKFKTKRYIHFDKPINIKEVESYVTDPKKIETHSFLPFIYYTIDFERYKKEEEEKYKRPVKEKNRNIMYSGHLDSYIYKYYGLKLNIKYNDWTIENKIDDVSIAYRDNKEGKSNVDFAAEVINQIVSYENAYILIGDFETFFETLNHQILKKRLQDVLGTKCLRKDWYNVFRSVTKYGYYEKKNLIEEFGDDSTLRDKKKTSYFENLDDFRTYQKKNKVSKNRSIEGSRIGIPQGTSISAVLANVYSSHFDIEMKKLADNYNGFYRRYSDDFIFILPEEQSENNIKNSMFKSLQQNVMKITEDNYLRINEEKTELYKYSSNEIINLKKNTKGTINYLGFVFNGREVRMRGKSAYKFYRKAKLLINKAKSAKEKKIRAGEKVSKLPYRKKIYSLYTDLGDKYKHGNFISYAKKSQNIFDKKCPRTTNLMMNQIKERKKFIEKQLGYRIHTKV